MTMGSTSLFKISNFIIAFRDTKNIELMATGANIPGLTLGELNVSRPVIRDLRPGDTLSYNDLIVTCLCDEKLQAYKDIYDYVITSANPTTAGLNVDYPVFDSTLLLTTNKNNVQHQLRFLNCFFKGIGEIQLTSGSTEEEHVSFDITLGYSYYLFE